MKILIPSNMDVNNIKAKIYDHFSNKKVKIEETDYDLRYLFDIIPTKQRFCEEFYDDVTKLIFDLILKDYSKDIIDKQIRNKFYGINSDEQMRIASISQQLLLNKENFLIEKEYIINQIKDYVKEKSFVSMDGFLMFRLKGFSLFIDLVVDKGMEEFTLEKEYKEFIKILQYFVDIQEPKHNLINIIFDDEGYRLLDGFNNEIDNDYFEKIVFELEELDINDDDLLISSLIVLCPQSIIIHEGNTDKNEDIIRIITDVFEDRIYFCPGCQKCIKSTEVKNN